MPGSSKFDDIRVRAYCACSKCWLEMFGYFFSRLAFLFSFSLSLGDGPISAEILPKRAVKPNAANQPTNRLSFSVYKYLSGKQIYHFHFSSFLNESQLLKEGICSCKIFFQESMKEIIEVVPLYINDGKKHGILYT